MKSKVKKEGLSSEEDNHEAEDDDYQDYTEAETLDSLDESMPQDSDVSGTEHFSTEQKGK